jgi:hypothetical protein
VNEPETRVRNSLEVRFDDTWVHLRTEGFCGGRTGIQQQRDEGGIATTIIEYPFSRDRSHEPESGLKSAAVTPGNQPAR